MKWLLPSPIPSQCDVVAPLLLLIPQPPALQLSDWLNPMSMYDLMGKFIEIYGTFCLISGSPNLDMKVDTDICSIFWMTLDNAFKQEAHIHN